MECWGARKHGAEWKLEDMANSCGPTAGLITYFIKHQKKSNLGDDLAAGPGSVAVRWLGREGRGTREEEGGVGVKYAQAGL